MDYLREAILSVRKERFLEIEALWVFTKTADRMQRFLLKSSVPSRTIERLYLNAGIAEALLENNCNCNVIYDYENDVIHPKGWCLDEGISEEITGGHLLTVYDRKRENRKSVMEFQQ